MEMPDYTIKINNFASLSALGAATQEVLDNYKKNQSLIKEYEIEGFNYAAARLSESSENKVAAVMAADAEYKKLDRTVQMTLAAGRDLIKKVNADYFKTKQVFINIGSSRGATSVFENAHRSYLTKNSVPVLTSPFTTLGNISSWLLQDLKLNGVCLSTSVTCSTALQAICNSYAWLTSGLCDYAIAGGAEAPLTGFTMAQMKALRIYGTYDSDNLPCTPCAEIYSENAGIVLGEGACLFLLEKKNITELDTGDLYIESFGFASEKIDTATSISAEADCIYSAMKNAVKELSDNDMPEVVLMHAPGTALGDSAEIRAVEKLYADRGLRLPVVISNKWIIGHTFGAAGAFNLEYACLMLKNNFFADFPYRSKFSNSAPDKIRRVILNSAGFGGNSTSLVAAIK